MTQPRNISESSIAVQRKQAVELLEYVGKADYDKIEQIWKQNPILMFMKVGSLSGKAISPLQYALFNLDTWTWKPFYEWLVANDESLAESFLQQNAELKNHVDLTQLLEVYETTIAHPRIIYERVLVPGTWSGIGVTSISDNPDGLKAHWKNLYQAQSKSLPWHMIREMCRTDGEKWSPDSMFSAATAPKGGRACVENNASRYVDIDSYYDFKNGFGKNFGIIRGNNSHAYIHEGPSWNMLHTTPIILSSNEGVKAMVADMNTIKRLHERRMSELLFIPKPVQTESNVTDVINKFNAPENKSNEVNISAYETKIAEMQAQIDFLVKNAEEKNAIIKDLKAVIAKLTTKADHQNKPQGMHLFRK